MDIEVNNSAIVEKTNRMVKHQISHAAFFPDISKAKFNFPFLTDSFQSIQSP